MARPGIFAGQIYDAALDMAADAGFADYFMGVGPQRIRFVGHGVGLELDEFPFLAQGQNLALQENMVIALEPKLILPGRGVVGIENSHVVTPDGLTPLTAYPDMITTV
jgi:Xaa-Pro aminopeptidase